MSAYDLDAAVFDGCAFGLLSSSGVNKGKPIKKPWMLMTDCPSLVQSFSGKGCPGPETHVEHAPSQGADTARTGYYTRPMCALIHKSWQRHVKNMASVAQALIADIIVDKTELPRQQNRDAEAGVPFLAGDAGSRPCGSGLGLMSGKHALNGTPPRRLRSRRCGRQ